MQCNTQYRSMTLQCATESSLPICADTFQFCVVGRCLLCLWEPLYHLMFIATSAAVQWHVVRAWLSVKCPSRVRRTAVHTAVLRSSRPTSCTTLRRYRWVSFKHCTSAEITEQIAPFSLHSPFTFHMCRHWMCQYPLPFFFPFSLFLPAWTTWMYCFYLTCIYYLAFTYVGPSVWCRWACSMSICVHADLESVWLDLVYRYYLFQIWVLID